MAGEARGELKRYRPLFAVLRGITPGESEAVGAGLVESGFEILEVTMNSPDPFASIANLVKSVGDRALVGAGTILSRDEIDRLEQAGGRLVVSPHCDPDLIAYAATKGMVCLPGVLTPSEMFRALQAGATGLKIFPAELYSPAAVKAARAVLPRDVPVYVVGGINAGNMAEYLRAGATGFGVGSSLYRSGKNLDALREDARAIVSAFEAACKEAQ